MLHIFEDKIRMLDLKQFSSESSLMFKWLFHILIFANVSGKYQNKEKPLKRQRKLGLIPFLHVLV